MAARIHFVQRQAPLRTICAVLEIAIRSTLVPMRCFAAAKHTRLAVPLIPYAEAQQQKHER